MASQRQLRVLIAGGGPAAVEALLALRDLAEERVELEMLSPGPELVYRPLAVAEPFGLGQSRRYDLREIAADQGASFRQGALESVETAEHVVRLADGGETSYDVLVVTVGAVPETPFPDAVTVLGPDYTGRFRTILRQLDGREVSSVAFVVPGGVSWPLPLYELALMTAATVRPRRREREGLRLTVVTPEEEPLGVFGHEASTKVRSLLEDRGLTLHTGSYPSSFGDGVLEVTPRTEEPIPAEHCVTLPVLRGPRVRGLPSDDRGFIPVDLHGLVQGEADVYAAGDATNFPLKQGGLATQQADAVAEAIAARAGAAVEPHPFHPVLRGLLLTGEIPTYMRAEIGGGRGEEWEVSDHALWWPPSKIAGQYLSPYLGLHRGEVREREFPLEVELEHRAAGGARRWAVIVPGNEGQAMRISDDS